MRRWLEPLAQDLGYAVRSFRRSPAFVLVALLSLTLGIGATSAIFSVIYGVLIAPYPYARPGEIWAPEVRALDGRGGHAYTLDELRAPDRGAGVLRRDGDVDRNRAHDGRVRTRELQRRPAVRQRVQFSRRAAGDRPDHPADRHSTGRPGRTGRGVEPPAVASAVRGQSVSRRPDAAAERPPAHDRRRDAAALWLVWQRGVLAPAVADAHRPAVDQSHRAAGARRVEGRGRGAAQRAATSASRRRSRRRFRRRASRPRCGTTWT